VKRPTNKKVKRRAVQSQAGEGLARRREQIECTQLQLSGSARTAGSVVVFATSADPRGFRTSTQDVEAQGAAKEHTSEARGDDRLLFLLINFWCDKIIIVPGPGTKAFSRERACPTIYKSPGLC